MRAEIVSVGTELLLGQILNTNTQFLSDELAQLGVDCFWQSTVGDNKERIKECLRLALSRVELVLTTGGLGPTADDLTMECLAELFATQMVFDQATMDKIEMLFKGRGVKMVESNRKQALRPVGADILDNPVGTAPGVIWRLSGPLLTRAGIERPETPRYLLTFPGVPSEMKEMWRQTARQIVAEAAGSGSIWSCELKHYGIGESSLAEMYADLLDGVNPTVAPLAGVGECRLRVTAKAGSAREAEALAEPVVRAIREKSGILCYGADDDRLETAIGRLLSERGQTVSFAESCTGGLVSKLLTDVGGASRYVKMNVVTYSNEAKQELLGVPQVLLDENGAVSPECALAMAEGVRRLAGADIGCSITGIAGPDGGTPEKPVGLVYLALTADGARAERRLSFPPEMPRSEIRSRTAKESLNLLRLFLLDPARLRNAT